MDWQQQIVYLFVFLQCYIKGVQLFCVGIGFLEIGSYFVILEDVIGNNQFVGFYLVNDEVIISLIVLFVGINEYQVEGVGQSGNDLYGIFNMDFYFVFQFCFFQVFLDNIFQFWICFNGMYLAFFYEFLCQVDCGVVGESVNFQYRFWLLQLVE